MSKTQSSDGSSAIPEAAFNKKSPPIIKRPPLKSIENILGNVGGATITFPSEKEGINHDDEISKFSIDEFSCQLELNDSVYLSDFIDSDPNLYGSKTFTDKMKSMSSLSPRYLKEKNNDWNRFLVAVSLHPKLRILSKMVADPQNKTEKVPYLVTLCRDGYTRPKYNILNACFVAFSLTLKKKGCEKINLGDEEFTQQHVEAVYKPNTLDVMYKRIFAALKSLGVIAFSHTHSFNESGGFKNFWKIVMSKCKAIDDTYNHRSRDSQFDPDADEKIRKNKRWKPWENYQDCLVLLTHYVLRNFMLRGRKEVSFNFFLNFSQNYLSNITF